MNTGQHPDEVYRDQWQRRVTPIPAPRRKLTLAEAEKWVQEERLESGGELDASSEYDSGVNALQDNSIAESSRTPDSTSSWPPEAVERAARAMYDARKDKHMQEWDALLPSAERPWRALAEDALAVVAPAADLREVERLARENTELRADLTSMRAAFERVTGAMEQETEALRKEAAQDREHTRQIVAEAGLGPDYERVVGERDAAFAELARCKNGARWLSERLESAVKREEAAAADRDRWKRDYEIAADHDYCGGQAEASRLRKELAASQGDLSRLAAELSAARDRAEEAEEWVKSGPWRERIEELEAENESLKLDVDIAEEHSRDLEHGMDRLEAQLAAARSGSGVPGLIIPSDAPEQLARAVEKGAALSGCSWDHVHSTVNLVKRWMQHFVFQASGASVSAPGSVRGVQIPEDAEEAMAQAMARGDGWKDGVKAGSGTHHIYLARARAVLREVESWVAQGGATPTGESTEPGAGVDVGPSSFPAAASSPGARPARSHWIAPRTGGYSPKFSGPPDPTPPPGGATPSTVEIALPGDPARCIRGHLDSLQVGGSEPNRDKDLITERIVDELHRALAAATPSADERWVPTEFYVDSRGRISGLAPDPDNSDSECYQPPRTTWEPQGTVHRLFRYVPAGASPDTQLCKLCDDSSECPEPGCDQLSGASPDTPSGRCLYSGDLDSDAQNISTPDTPTDASEDERQDDGGSTG